MNASRSFDDLDIRIASLLGVDGRLSNREIARRLNISEGNVRRRLGQMISSGALRVTAQVNIESMPETYLALVGVKIDGRRLNECAARVAKLPSVMATMVVTGRYDLLAIVLAPSRRTLVDFVTDELSDVPGVRDSETYVTLKSMDFWVAAEKLFSPATGSETEEIAS